MSNEGGFKVAMVETGGWGGIGHYTHCLCEALCDAGIQARLVTHARNYQLDKFPKHYEVEKLFLGDGMGADWERLRRSVARHGDDFVHFQSIIAPRRDWAMLRWLQLRGGFPKVVLTAHNILPHEVRLGDRFAYRQIYKACDGIIVHSQSSLDHLARLMGDRFVSRHPVTVVPHGHYGMLTEPNGASRKESLATLELPEARYITCFGAIRPYKGIDWLLEAVAAQQLWPDDTKVLVIGKVLTGVQEGDLTGLAERLGISDRVIFRFEYLDESQIPDLFAVSDLIALPYRKIDQSGVLLAALAAGKPVLATPVGAFTEIVDASIGFMAPQVSQHGVQTALAMALAQRASWSNRGRAALALSEREFGWSRVAEQTLDFYRRFVGSPIEQGST